MKLDIDKLLLKVMNDKASSDEYAALEQWKTQSAENLALLQQLTKEHDIVSEYKDYDAAAAWHNVDSEITKPTPSYKILGYTIAACVFALIAYWGYQAIQSHATSLPSKYIAAEQTLELALQDQSNIWLKDGGSTLEVISDFETERAVKLAGTAYFEITHDTKRPFFVYLNDEDKIQVVGTSFAITNKDGELDIIVYTGQVNFHTLDRTIPLEKGDRVTRVNGTIAKYKHNNTNQLSWKTNELLFDNAGLNEVFIALERHFDITINYQSETNDISKCKLRTRFINEELTTIMRELQGHFDFTYTANATAVNISGISCK